MTTAYDRLAARLAEVTGATIRNGSTICPAHDDGSPSLSIANGDGKVLLRCHAGCELDAILAALGLSARDLFDRPKEPVQRRREVDHYDYVDEEGELLFEVVRYEPKDFRQRRPDGSGGWIWKLGDTRRVLYRLPHVLDAKESGAEVWVVEGEKDVHALEGAGVVATTCPGGAGKWRTEYTTALAGTKVSIVADDDEPGRRHALDIAAQLKAAGCTVTRWLPAEGHNDVAEHLGAGRTLDGLRALDSLDELDGDPEDLAPYLATTLANVDPEPVEWLWPDHLPLGKPSVFDGDPDVGKSTVALDLTARVTIGEPMPGQTRASIPASDVILMAAEDGLGDTIRPRLDAAGADLSRVHHLDKVPRVDDEGRVTWTFPSIPEDLKALDALVSDTKAKLVIVDVLMAYLSGNADSYRDQDVRRHLEPLGDLAKRHQVCVLMIRHLRKSRGSALYAGGGSIGIIGVARAGMVAAADPADETGQRRVLARSKGNLAPGWPSLGYKLVKDEDQLCARVEWLGEVGTTADELLSPPIVDDDSDVDDAKSVLRQVLGDGPVWVKDALDKMREAGFSKDQAKRAKAKLKVRSEKFGKPKDADQGWKWVLEGSDNDDEPDNDDSEGSTEGSEGGGVSGAPPFAPFVLPSQPSEGALGPPPTEGEGKF